MKGKRNILIAGGAGFIGTNLTKRLLCSGCKVTCFDNLSSGLAVNAEIFAQNPDYRFVKCDITESIEHLVPNDTSAIINLACLASPKFYYAHPVKTMITSVAGMKNLLDQAVRLQAPILQASTSEVYGDPDRTMLPLKEACNGNVSCTGPRACYDEGKRSAETLCMDYRRVHGADVRIIRIFNTYGPHMRIDDGRVILAFIDSALKGEPLTINGDGRQTRSFMYIDDLIDAILIAIQKDTKLDTPINIGNPHEEITISELAERIIKMTGSRSIVVYKEALQHDPRLRRPDISLAKSALGWSPKVMLNEGLDRTIEYFRLKIIKTY